MAAAGQDQPQAANPFADFETIIFPNGLKVWYKRLPSDPNVSISITVPYGSDQDPDGKEQLAHFTEHMLFSDHLGRSHSLRCAAPDRPAVQDHRGHVAGRIHSGQWTPPRLCV